MKENIQNRQLVKTIQTTNDQRQRRDNKVDIPLEVVKQFVPIYFKLIPARTRPAGCPEAILLSQKIKESNSAMIEYLLS